MQILSQQQIKNKIKRLAIEILEHNLDAKSLIFLGINNNGYGFAQLLIDALPKGTDKPNLYRLYLNPAKPLADDITIEGTDLKEINKSNIVIVDDVANTGRTLFYALKPLMDAMPAKVQIAVLVDRRHKSFPVVPDYVGLSLATTMREVIEVNILEKNKQSVFLR